MKNSEIVCVIPARFQSQRFPGKMLADIAGVSLIQRTYANAKKVSLFDTLVVATDDVRIFDHVKEFGGEVVMSSPHALTGSDRAAEVVEKYFPEAEIVVVLQGDEPLLPPLVIETLVADLKNNPQSHMSTPVEEITNRDDIFLPGVVKCIFNEDKKALYFSRAPIPYVHRLENIERAVYYRHIGVYCFRKSFLMQYPKLPPSRLQMIEDLEQLKVIEHGFSIYISVVPPHGVIGVDYPEDIKKIEAFLCRENTSLLQAASSLL